MLYEVTRTNSDYGLPFRFGGEEGAPDDDAPVYTCAEPPVWHEEADCVATVFAFLMHVPNALDDDAVTTALTMAISGIVRYENLGKKETTDFLTVHDYVWALIRAKRTG